MGTAQLGTILRHLQGLGASRAARDLSDAQLLARFAARGDQGAFAELVRRHGRLVWGVCRHVLAHEQDAEDAFQATFIVLALKAAAVRKGEALAGWLHRAAYHSALQVRRQAARRRVHEQRAQAMPRRKQHDETGLGELQALLDEEVARLPETLRAPFVLCCLEGQSGAEAAQELGWKEGTVTGRLCQARKLLRQRLSRRGVTLSAVLCATALSSRTAAAVPADLAGSTIQVSVAVAADGTAAGTLLSSPVAAAVKGVSQALSAGGSRVWLALALTLSVLASGTGLLMQQRLPANQTEERTDTNPKAEIQRPGVDRYGDPLPPGALMRLGTRRHRVQDWPLTWHSPPDGRSYLVHQRIGGSNAEIRRLDAVTGRVLEAWPVPERQQAVGFSPDGRYVLITNYFIIFSGFRLQGQKEEKQEWQLTLYDLVRRQAVWTNRASLTANAWRRIDSVCFSPDGKWFVTASGFGDVRFWDAATGTQLWHDKQEGRPVQPLGFSAGGDVLVLRGREDNTIYLVDRATGKQQRSFPTMSQREAHEGTLAPDGSAVLFGHYSPHIRIWDVATGKERPSLQGHKKWARSIAFAPDGRTLVTGGNDDFVLVRDWPSEKVIRTIELGSWCIERMAVSGDGRRLEVLFWGEQALHFYDLATGKTLPTPQDCHRANVFGIAFTPDGALLSGGRDATVRTWDLKTGKAVGLFEVEQDLNTGAFAVSRDGRLLATANSDFNAICVHERATGRLIRKLPLERAAKQLAFSPDGRWLAGAKNDGSAGTIVVWELATGRTALHLKQAQVSYGVSCAFSPDGRQFTASEHGQVRFWNTSTWREQASLAAYAPLGIAFSPDGRTLAAACVEGIRLYELATHRERAHIRLAGYPHGALQFSSSGHRLAWVNDQRTIHVWDIYRGTLLGPFTGHEDSVTGLAFTRDDRALASSSDDSTILLWDLAGAAEKKVQAPGGDIDSAWQALTADDGKAAFDAIRVLMASPNAAVERIAQNLKPAAAIDANQVQSWLRDLDSDQFPVRDRATRALEQVGDRAAPALEQFLTTRPSLEPRRRAERLLARVSGLVHDPQRLREARALEVLEHLGSDDARRPLEALAKGAPEAGLTREARAALERVGRPGNAAK
jgi:RNA polymerase sigma factor (sigma-70 family)